MKKYLKKTLSILLVATNFTFLFTTLETSNVLTYANAELQSKTEQKQDIKETTVESDTEEITFESETKSQNSDETTVESDSEQDEEKPAVENKAEQAQEKTTAESENEQRQDIEIVTSEFFPSEKFVHYKGTPFYFDASLKDAYNRSKKKLDKIYKKAKEKIQAKLKLTYPDDLEIPIYVHFSNTDAGAFYWTYIQIDPNYLSDNETLAHEMTHALLYHILGENTYTHLNLGLEEGFAMQNNSLDYFCVELPKQNKCFATSFPSDDTEIRIFYKSHQHMVHDWIEENGKSVVKKFLEKVKNGEDSVQAFWDLGGDKIVEKYNCTIETSKFKESFSKFEESFSKFIHSNVATSITCGVISEILSSVTFLSLGSPTNKALLCGAISGALCAVVAGVDSK